MPAELDDQIRERLGRLIEPVDTEQVLGRVDAKRERQRRRQMLGRSLAAAAVLAIVGVAALATWAPIGGDGAVEIGPVGPPGDTTAPGSDSAWTATIRLIPNDPDLVGYWIEGFDIEAAASHHGIERPGAGASTDARVAYVEALGEAGGYHLPTLLRRGGWDSTDAMVESFRDQLGIDPTAIRRWIEWGALPENGMILEGDFDADVVAAALRSNNWPDELTEPGYRGISYFSWREDFSQDISNRTEFNVLGSSVRIAVIDNLFVMTRSTAMMEQVIDRYLDDAPTDELGLDPLLRASDSYELFAIRLMRANGLESAPFFTALGTRGDTDPPLFEEGVIIISPLPGTPIDELLADVEALVAYATSGDDFEAFTRAISIISDDDVVTIRVDGTAIDPNTPIPEQTGDEMGAAEWLWRRLTFELTSPPLEDSGAMDDVGAINEFCAVATELEGEKPESYVGSEEHIADIRRLRDAAPAGLREDVDGFLTYFESGGIDPTDPNTSTTENHAEVVRAATERNVRAAIQLQTVITRYCGPAEP